MNGLQENQNILIRPNINIVKLCKRFRITHFRSKIKRLKIEWSTFIPFSKETSDFFTLCVSIAITFDLKSAYHHVEITRSISGLPWIMEQEKVFCVQHAAIWSINSRLCILKSIVSNLHRLAKQRLQKL